MKRQLGELGELPESKCRLLHVRNSAASMHVEEDSQWLPGMRTEAEKEEDETFLEWNLGPDGLPNLDIVAFGDFFYVSTEGESTALYCRDRNGEIATDGDGSAESGKGYRVLTKEDSEIWEFYQSNLHMLESGGISVLRPDD
ncbi:hypothetical protein BJX70DRAFT_373963 [Aspergillus crustosus]